MLKNKIKIKKLIICNNGDPVAELSRTGHYSLQYLPKVIDYYERNNIPFGSLTEKTLGIQIPVSEKNYNSGGFDGFPLLGNSLPEGFLQEQITHKLNNDERYRGFNIDHMFILPLLRNNIGRLSFIAENEDFNALQKNFKKQQTISFTSLDEILKGNSTEAFNHALNGYLNNFSLFYRQGFDVTSLSGYQPKVSANIGQKETLIGEGYIIKTFDSKIFNHLSLNEYICNLVAKNAGLNVPEFYLSDDQKLFVVKRFDLDESKQKFFGVEDFCSIRGIKNSEKYQGNYTFVGEAIKRLSKNPNDVGNFFQYLALSAKLRNGDAHLKNFSLMYHNESDIHLSPLYNVVNTLVYPMGFDKFGKPTNDNFAMPLERGGSKDFPLTADLIKFGEKLGLSSQFCKESIERIEESLYETLRDNKSRFTQTFYTQFTDSVNMSDRLAHYIQPKSDSTFRKKF